jgi:ribosomal protein L3 glutamine methyltransferase
VKRLHVDKFFSDEIISNLCTVREVLDWANSCFSVSKIFYGHGTDNSWDEAVQLILPSLNLSVHSSVEACAKTLTASELENIIERVALRIKERTPVAYITKKAWFCGCELYVDRRVLVPRSPIGELIMNGFSGIISGKLNRVLDLCTGSGCIAIAIANMFREVGHIDATDISTDALQVAKRNVAEYRLENRISLIQADLFYGLPKVQYDIIVSNPPYVDTSSMECLLPEYCHEPRVALEAGSSGLRLAKRILAHASGYLSENGVLICEIGDSMSSMIQQYPGIPFTWLDFDNGGHGVFMLTKHQIIGIQHYFLPSNTNLSNLF